MFADAAKLATATVGVESSGTTAPVAASGGDIGKVATLSSVTAIPSDEVIENRFWMPEIQNVWLDKELKRRLSLTFNPPAGVTSDDVWHSISMDGMQLIIDYKPPGEFSNADPVSLRDQSMWS